MITAMTHRNLSAPRWVVFVWCGLAFFCLFFLTSCSVGNYTPDAAIAKGVGKNLEAFPGSVAIENAQESRLEQHLGFLNTVVNYHDFTQSVVDALKNELQAKGTTVAPDANKKLSVQVVEVSYFQEAVTYRAVIKANVQTGAGDIHRFESSRASYASGANMTFAAKKPLDAAFKDLVSNILKDTSIQAYLKN